MERLDFASVMAVLRRNISEDICPNQLDLIEALFRDMGYNPDSCMEFDNGLVCRWMNGLAKLSPKITTFYQDNYNQRKLAWRIEQEILPMMPDSAMAVQELYDLLMQAPNVSTQKKAELSDGFSFEDENDEAVFITDILCFAMQLRFEKRDVRSKQLLTPGNLSPAVVDYIFDSDMPRPCRWFLGRKQELEQLHELLVDHSKVFLHGIPGIGKSELAKTYAKQYSKEYTNILYMNYVGDLKQNITDMDFADDLPDETDEARFKRHNRFLRSLKEDTLLIVDNFNVTTGRDDFLDVMLKYRCRILFTTRSRYESHISLELTELSQDKLLELMGKFFPGTEKKPEIMEQIIDLLHGHTFAVELAARLLANSMLNPKALLKKLKAEKAGMDADDKIGSTKDGRSKKATYYDHIHTLFSLYRLSKAEQEIMRCMIFVPANGVTPLRFGTWMDLKNLNTVNDLVEMGFIQPRNDRYISLHPMIQEIAVEELKPSVDNCGKLLDGLQEISLLHGIEMSGYKQLFQTVENIVALIRKDNLPKYLLFLENVFEYMEKYHYEAGVQTVIGEIESILADKSVGTAADRALLLECRAACEEDTSKAILLIQDAIGTLGEVNAKNAHLASNLHSNIGAMYHEQRKYDLAQMHMEQGISLLEQYGLTGYHDRVVQISNYAVLLADMGEAQRGYSAVMKLARKVRELNSDQCLDYGHIQQTLGGICMGQGNAEQANIHFQKAMAIYETVFEEEPLLLEQKRQEIEKMTSPVIQMFGRRLIQ